MGGRRVFVFFSLSCFLSLFLPPAKSPESLSKACPKPPKPPQRSPKFPKASPKAPQKLPKGSTKTPKAPQSLPKGSPKAPQSTPDYPQTTSGYPAPPPRAKLSKMMQSCNSSPSYLPPLSEKCRNVVKLPPWSWQANGVSLFFNL